MMKLTELRINGINWDLSWIRLNEFKVFYVFELTKITVTTVLRFFLITCNTVSRKPFINIEANSKISQMSYSFTVVERKIKFL